MEPDSRGVGCRFRAPRADRRPVPAEGSGSFASAKVQQLPAFLCIGAVPNFAREHSCFRKEAQQVECFMLESKGLQRFQSLGASDLRFGYLMLMILDSLSRQDCSQPPSRAAASDLAGLALGPVDRYTPT